MVPAEDKSLQENLNSGTILVLSGARGDTRRYRTFHLWQQLRLAGLGGVLSHITDPELPARFRRAELVILHRVSYDPYIAGLLEALHRRGGIAVMDTDDLVFDLSAFQWIDSPDFQDPIRSQLFVEDMQRIRQTLLVCDAVTASTAYLRDQARTLDKPAWIHRNAFSLEMLAAAGPVADPRPDPERVVIGYASGTPTHDKDFALVKPALIDTLRRYPQAELRLIGPLNPGEDWQEFGGRVRRHGLVPWRELPALLAEFDINLAPLVSDNPFGQSKSEIKYMEAALLRRPTIASPTQAFQYAIRDGENGLLAEGREAWTAAFQSLIEQPELRLSIGQRAFDDVLERYHPYTRSAELARTLNAIRENLQGRSPLQVPAEAPLHETERTGILHTNLWIDPALDDHPTHLQMAFYSLRHRGLATVSKQVWIFFRRMIAPVVPYRRRPASPPQTSDSTG